MDGMSAPIRENGVPPSRPLLSVEGVTLEYQAPGRVVRATQNVSFDVWEADRFILLGASGCGKSTLLKSVGGFIAPRQGRILLDGLPVHGPGPDRVVVFQEFDQLPPWKTVRENVAFPVRVSGRLSRKEAAERAEHYIEKVGLTRFADAYPNTLSGGMKQRVPAIDGEARRRVRADAENGGHIGTQHTSAERDRAIFPGLHPDDDSLTPRVLHSFGTLRICGTSSARKQDAGKACILCGVRLSSW
ncbi:ABC transporter ATP-binding protein [Rhizobium laguerreae]|uniref:ABC transporter ATP-binding protein n=1 Tax=Rhizobium laguerreae TaxID=1076926 RepID=UPI0021B0DB23|nr:ATP-binding cassette domain-containing protein [Rhizobium laguerreae]